jgi:DNA-binding transcriptional regulator YdaS (Cro superfamily)
MNKHLLDTIIKHYGSQRKLARALCVTEGAVSQWVNSGWFPAAQAIRIERSLGFKKVRATELVQPD